MGRNQWWLVVAAGLTVFMATVDASIVNVALPVIEHDLGTVTSTTEWVVVGYLLPLVALLLPAGRWLDRVGSRPALLFGLTGFTLASVAAGVAPNITTLIAARVVQGGFGAVLFAVTPVVAMRAVRPEMRGRAVGVIATLGPLGAVSGPPLGGLLSDQLGWPWIFYVNVPVAVVVGTIGWRKLDAGARLDRPDRALLLEVLLIAGAGASVLLGLSLGASQGPVWLLLIAAAVPLVVVWSRLPGTREVRSLVRTRGVTEPHVALLVVTVAAAIVQFVLPFYLQREIGLTPSATGLVLLVFPLSMATVGLLSGWLADSWGARPAALLGTIVGVTGIASLAGLDAGWSAWDITWRLVIFGIGFGLFNAPNQTMAFTAAPGELLGTVSASTGLARQLGFLLGPALGTAGWALGGYQLGGMRLAIGGAAVISVGAVLALARRQPRRAEAQLAGAAR